MQCFILYLQFFCESCRIETEDTRLTEKDDFYPVELTTGSVSVIRRPSGQLVIIVPDFFVQKSDEKKEENRKWK